jgi:hypothetical protein
MKYMFTTTQSVYIHKLKWDTDKDPCDTFQSSTTIGTAKHDLPRVSSTPRPPKSLANRKRIPIDREASSNHGGKLRNRGRINGKTHNTATRPRGAKSKRSSNSQTQRLDSPRGRPSNKANHEPAHGAYLMASAMRKAMAWSMWRQIYLSESGTYSREQRDPCSSACLPLVLELPEPRAGRRLDNLEGSREKTIPLIEIETVNEAKEYFALSRSRRRGSIILPGS